MTAIVNFMVLILSAVLFTVFYNYSVQPARLETKMGQAAWGHCGRVRKLSFVFYGIIMVCYVLYGFSPLNHTFSGFPLPRFFGWGWIPSVAVGLVISIFSIILLLKATSAAKKESYTPRKENEMYGGIYKKIRHPQAIGDSTFYVAIGFFVNSPLLVLVSLLWLPIYYYISLVEERDLLVRYGEPYKKYMEQTGMFIPKH